MLKRGAPAADEMDVGAAPVVEKHAIEELVEHYRGKGRAVGRAGVALGASAGVLVGAVPLSPLAFAWPIPASFGFATVLGGLFAGLLVGFVVGDARARMYHRMAEQARLQLELDQRLSQSDLRMAQLVAALASRATAQPAPAVPVPVPAPTVHVAATQPPVIPVLAQPAAVEPVEVEETYIAPPLSLPAPTPLRPAAVVTEQPAPVQAPLLSAVPTPAAVPEPQPQAAQGGYTAPPLSPPLSG